MKLSEEDQMFLGMSTIAPLKFKGIKLITYNYNGRNERIKQFVTKIVGWDEGWGSKKQFINPYHEASINDFLQVVYDIFHPGIYEFRNFMRNIKGQTISGHFLYTGDEVRLFEGERLVITPKSMTIHFDREGQ